MTLSQIGAEALVSEDFDLDFIHSSGVKMFETHDHHIVLMELKWN